MFFFFLFFSFVFCLILPRSDFGYGCCFFFCPFNKAFLCKGEWLILPGYVSSSCCLSPFKCRARWDMLIAGGFKYRVFFNGQCLNGQSLDFGWIRTVGSVPLHLGTWVFVEFPSIDSGCHICFSLLWLLYYPFGSQKDNERTLQVTSYFQFSLPFPP